MTEQEQLAELLAFFKSLAASRSSACWRSNPRLWKNWLSCLG